MNATPISVVQVMFTEQYTKAKKIPYNPEWNAGRDYFNGIVHGEHAPLLHPGEIVRSIDDRKRRIIVVGTLLGNVAVFQRYGSRKDMYCCNTSDTMGDFSSHSLASELESGHMCFIFGIPHLLENLGLRTVEYNKEDTLDMHIEMYEQEKQYI